MSMPMSAPGLRFPRIRLRSLLLPGYPGGNFWGQRDHFQHEQKKRIQFPCNIGPSRLLCGGSATEYFQIECWLLGLGFRAEGLGFSGFTVKGLGFRV